jgi:ubiquinone/menaquinone biosynthesis C-methylase UbiE
MIFKKVFQTNSVVTQYARIADKYNVSTRQIFDADKYRRRLTGWMELPKGPKKILDVGCGEGTFTNLLNQEFTDGGSTIGIDVSREMIAHAKTNYPDIDFRVEAMENMSLHDDEIDFVFARFAVHYSLDIRKTLTEINRVTKPGGLFFLKDVHPIHATFLKKSFDYAKKENVNFWAQGDDNIRVIHPTFTLQEYINNFSKTGWNLESIYETYGRDASSEQVAPYRVPTSICFILKKRE